MLKRPRTERLVAVAAAVGILLISSAPASAAPDTSEQSISELKIGVLQELTGPAAELGAACSAGLQIAFQSYTKNGMVGGRSVKLIIGDVHDNAGVALSEYHRMVDQAGAQVVIPLRSKTAMPINPLSERDQVLSVGIVGHPKYLDNPYALRVYATAEQEAEAFVTALSQLGKHRIASLSLEDEWALSLGRAFSDELKRRGQALILDTTVLPSDVDFGTTITRLKVMRPDGVFVNLLGKSALFIKKAYEQGLRTQIASCYWIQQKEQLELAGRQALEGAIFAEVDSNKPIFRKLYQEAFPTMGYNPVGYLCYTALGLVLKAAAQPGALTERAALRAALFNLDSVELLDGIVPIKNREAKLGVAVRVIRAGQVSDFSPPLMRSSP
jgi:ABC-type branched-subunit amino acid transport system substrate-binding protein